MDQNEISEMGMNKTGVATAPKLSKEMIEASPEITVPSNGDLKADDVRLDFIKAGAKIGSVPPPASMKGVATAVMNLLTGKKATLFIDKVAERLAFERSGTRLYEALMIKCRALGDPDTLEKLEHIWAEELEHFHMLWECVEQLGADPTVQTPSADIAAVTSQGIPKVLADPRTTFAQSLEAIMTAELVDGDAWERLAELAEGFGQTEMAKKFREALAEEREHQVIIRDLLVTQMKEEAGVS